VPTTCQDPEAQAVSQTGEFSTGTSGDYSAGTHTSSRFAALEPVSQAVIARFGGIEADAARGVTVRADNGPQYISDHFTRQIAHWGMALSHSFPHQPQTNGVAERFFRTLREQAIYGRIFQTAAEVRTTVMAFVARYNASWRLARLGNMPARLPGAACGPRRPRRWQHERSCGSIGMRSIPPSRPAHRRASAHRAGQARPKASASAACA
jgi:hypothetical protein